MIRLSLLDWPKASICALLDALPYSVQAYAICAGMSDGQIWTDHADRPRVLLIWDGRHNIYLSCRPDTSRRSLGIALYEDLEQTLGRRVLALGALAGQWGYVLQHGPPHLSEPLVRSLLHGREALPDLRRVYQLPPEGSDALSTDPPAAVGDLASCAIEPVDLAFLAKTRMNLEKVLDWIKENWRDTETYLEHGFGYALTEEETILSWCMAEYVCPGPDGTLRSGVGIETVPNARNRGYATHVARHFLVACHKRGVIPHWDCWNDNGASIAVAEKVGLVLGRTYPVRFGWHNALDRAVVHLRMALKRGDTRAAHGWLVRVVNRQAGPAADTARLWPDPELRRRLDAFPDLAQLLQ